MAATKAAPQRRRANGAGHLRQLPSGRWQAAFPDPVEKVVRVIKGMPRDMSVMHPAPQTFDTKMDADAWLKRQGLDVERGHWAPPSEKTVGPGTVGAYAETWLAHRTLRPKTRSQYRKLLDTLILPTLKDVPLDRLQPATVRNWWAGLDHAKPTWCSQGYQLLRAICRTAEVDDLIEKSPCRISGAGKSKAARKPQVATLDELAVIVEATPVRYRAMILLAAWCAMRFGELAELRRKDVDLERRRINVNRAVIRVDGVFEVGPPKTDAGKRSIALPPHLVDMLREHLDERVDEEPDALLFPARQGGHMATASLYRVFYPAREKAGLPSLRFHDLRHAGATLAAQGGATLADLMARLGHTTAAAALVYQHTALERDDLIARNLSAMVTA
jgi:integrase